MRTRVPNSLAATLMLAVWILSPLLAVVHVVLDEHTYCAEHQRLEEDADVHAPAVGPEQVAEHAKRSELRISAQLNEPDSEAPQDEHGACAFVDDFTRDELCLEQVVVSIPAPHAVLAGATLIASSVSCSIPLLRVAPKNSPPLTA